MSASSWTPRLFQLLEDPKPQWVEILEASSSIEDAQFVHPDTKLTPLHLAVMARDAEHNEARVGAIRSLLLSDLTATEVQCSQLGYTPLMYACILHDLDRLDCNVPVLKLLLDHNARAYRLRSHNGHSALDIHIVSMSGLQSVLRNQKTNPPRKQASNKGSRTGSVRSCTSILKALTEYDLGIHIPQSLDLLLSCNSLEVMEYVAQQEAQSLVVRLRDRRKQRSTGEPLPMPTASRRLQEFWVWDFVWTLLHSEHEHTFRDVKPVPPFNVLHTASQIADFPLPFLMLCMRNHPAQLRTPSVSQADLPIHSLASWDVTSEAKMVRKSMALTHLLSDHPTSARIPNQDGKTPLTLAIETGTAWNCGVRRLTSAQQEESVIHRQAPRVME